MIEDVSSLVRLDELRDAWTEAYRADPSAPFFASWDYQRGWLAGTGNAWTVLAYRPEPDAVPVAFLALERLSASGPRRLLARPDLRLAGMPLAGHTGLVCHPEHEREAVAAFARRLMGWRWGKLIVSVARDSRVQALLTQLGGRGCRVVHERTRENPVAALPDSFDAYLEETLRGKRRRELRRRQRLAGEAGWSWETVAAGADPEAFRRAVDDLLTLHQRRFRERDARELTLFRSTFRGAFEAGALHLNVLRFEGRAVAAQAGFVDRREATYHGCIGAWDDGHADLAPGILIRYDAIRWAIEQGLSTLDFGRGDDDYKQAMGGRSIPVRSFRIARPGVLDGVATMVRDAVTARSPTREQA